MEEHNEIRLSAQGRIVIPAALRRMLGFNPGDKLIAHKEQGRLVLEKASSVKRRLQQRFAHIPSETSLADQLIAERRQDAEKES